MKKPSLLLFLQILTLTLTLHLTFTHSLRFDLKSGHTKCMSEDIKSGAMAVGKYHVVNPNDDHPLPDSHKINARVSSTYGKELHSSDHVESGNFAFTAGETGDYMACFWVPEHNKPELAVTIDFEWKSGVAAMDWTSVAKKGQVETMELELKKLIDVIQSIHDEMFYLREREEEMQDLNKSTNSKMAWLSLCSLFICLLVAGMQLWYLKNFFERKKLL